MFSAHAGTSATVPPVVERNPHRRALATALARSELASHTLAWRKLRRALPVQQALAVLWDVMRMQVRGEPFSHLGHPEDERDRLSRRQIGPAILLYRSLRMRVDPDQALALTREVVLSSGVVFLEALLADVDPREAAPTEDPKRKLESLAERFFNAEGELVLLGERSASFDVCRAASWSCSTRRTRASSGRSSARSTPRISVKSSRHCGSAERPRACRTASAATSDSPGEPSLGTIMAPRDVMMTERHV
jgi:hypothetical protein